MASPPFSLVTSSPADNDIVSQFPALDRSDKDIIQSYLNTDHDFNTGNHNIISFVPQTADPSATGHTQFYHNSNGNGLNSITGGGLVRRIVVLAAGQKNLFPQSAVPTGWTLDTDVNDKMLRVNNSAGAGTGGSWDASTSLTIAGHALTINEMPSHTHTGAAVFGAGTGGGGGPPSLSGTTNTGSTGGDTAHSHGISSNSTWRPSYLDVVKGTMT